MSCSQNNQVITCLVLIVNLLVTLGDFKLPPLS